MKPVQTRCKVKFRVGIRRTAHRSAAITQAKALAFLKTALVSEGKHAHETMLRQNGNFGFGIKEYIDLPIKYDPKWESRIRHPCNIRRPGYRIRNDVYDRRTWERNTALLKTRR